MKTVTILRFLTFVGSGLSTLAALDLTGVASLLEPGMSKYLLAAGPAALAVIELVVVLGDLFAMAVLTLPFLSSCATPPGITGEFISKDGLIRVNPDGRVEIVVEPRTAK
jgi:hypothetical protein